MTTSNEITTEEQTIINEAEAYARDFIIARDAAYSVLSKDRNSRKDPEGYWGRASDIAHAVLDRQHTAHLRDQEKLEGLWNSSRDNR